MKSVFISVLFAAYCVTLTLALTFGCSPRVSSESPTPPPPPPPTFSATVSVGKVNGVVKTVTVNLPGEIITFDEKAVVETFIKTIEVLVTDLKAVSEQMEIVEPGPKPKPILKKGT